jgi:hypothetical protein
MSKEIKITKCECGSENFIVTEDMAWKAFVDEENVLQCTNQDGEIAAIICADCGKEFPQSDFNEINFN